MVSKLFEKSPLSSTFLQAVSVLNPHYLCTKSRKTVLQRWKNVLSHILEHNILSTKSCDEAMKEFKLFFDTEVVKFKSELSEFSKQEDRLDELYFDTLGIQKYPKFSYIVKLILTLSLVKLLKKWIRNSVAKMIA